MRKCVYCGQKITTPSEEHIIQNALGGRLKSHNICCGKCNNDQVSQILDKPFTNIFTPITANIPSFIKDKNSNTTPPYNAIAEFDGTEYDVTIKNGKISCPELAKKLKCDVSKLSGWKINGYRFNLDNQAFHNGMSKIALNYALACDIRPDILRHGIHMKKINDTITNIQFSYPVIPYMPLNTIDKILDFAPIQDINHSLILFTEENQLWCYIDLFNTFQYYVLLSEQYDTKTHIYKPYAQTFQQQDTSYIDKVFSEQEIAQYSPKDRMIIAQQYDLDPNFTFKQLKNKLLNIAYARDMNDIIRKRVNMYLNPVQLYNTLGNDEFMRVAPIIMSYFNDDKSHQNIPCLRDGTYRTLTPENNIMFSYPNTLHQIYKSPDGMKALRNYTTHKFNTLNNYIIQPQKTK